MALPNIASYGKNVIKSISYSAVDIAKNDMPTLAAFASSESNRELSRSIYSSVKDYKGTITKAKSAVMNSKLYELAEMGARGALEDIRTGKYYNKERIEAIESQAADEWMGGSFDDIDLDMNSGDSDISEGDRMVAGTVEMSTVKSAVMISETQVKASNAIIKAQKVNTQIMYQQGAQLLGGLKEVAYIGTQTQGAMVNLANIQKTVADNAKTYYESTTKIFQENNAMLKEMLEMQRALYKGQQNTDKNKNKANKVGYDDVIGGSGEVNFKEYFKSIKGNAKSALSNSTGGMLDMVMGVDPAVMKSMMASPLSGISNFLIMSLMPQMVRGSAKRLDNTMSGLGSQIIARFNKMAKDEDGSPISQILGQIFGLKSKTKVGLDVSKYNKGAVPFDGITRKAIVEVIPTYLRRIEAALTGQPEKIFDSGTGKWTDIRSIKKSYDQMKDSAKNTANADILEELRRVMTSKNAPKWADKHSKDQMAETIAKMLDKMYEDDGYFKPNKNEAYNMGVDPDLYKQIALLITDNQKNNPRMRDARKRHASEVMSAKQQLYQRLEQLEESGDSIFSTLFNNSTSADRMKTPKYEEKPKAFGGALDIRNQTDDLGHNIFYYLQNMYSELFSIRSGSGFGASSPMGGRFRVSNLAIPDVHKKTEGELYRAKSRADDEKYRKEIAKFTEKGGALYDISDGRGNILKDRANLEQMAIIQQIEDGNRSYGAINDFLYGNNTKLDSLNRTKSKNGEDGIAQGKFTDRFKATKNLTEKWAVIQDQVNRIAKAPAEKASKLLDRVDEQIYKFFFNDYTDETDEKGNKVSGFMQLMNVKLNATFDKMNTFFTDKIVDPIKKKLGIESYKDILDKLGVTQLWDGMKDHLLGQKNQDGKREGGIFGDVREEIKSTFRNAKNFVVNSMKEVFAPITNKIKDAMANRPKYKKESYDEDGNLVNSEDVTDINSVNFAPKAKKRDILPRTNPKEVLEADRNTLIHHIRFYASKIPDNNLSNFILDMIPRVIDAKSSADFANVKDEYEYYALDVIGIKEPEIIGFIIKLLNRLIKTYDKYNPPVADMIPYYRKAATKINKHRQNAANKKPGKPIQATRKASTTPSVNGNYEEAYKISNKLNEILDFGDVDSLAEVIVQLAGTGKNSKDILKNMTAGDIFKATEGNTYLPAFNRYFEEHMESVYHGRDMNIHDVINKKSTSSPITGIPIMNTVNETLNKILDVINSVVYNRSIVVTSSSKVSRPPILRRRPSTVGNGRESETEGDSTGDSDGQLDGIGLAAFGATFRRKTTSALSKGEIYGKNGLFAKVPKTGVYDIKAGTTIYPTNKDKAIEVAGEQSAISSYMSKYGIQSNAEGKQRETRNINGQVWHMGDDNKWHHKVNNADGTIDDYVMEPGFMDQSINVAKGGINQVLTGLGFKGLADSSAVSTMDDAMATIKKYAPKMTANGLLGGAVGLLSGNPLLGATIGAVTGYVQSSEKAKTMLFGEESTDEDGNKSRGGGIVSKDAQATIKKYAPNMSKYGVTGAALGLLTPFGLVGGAMLGSAVGWAASNDRIKEELFGKMGDATSGLISKEFRDKVKAAAPHMAVGAIGTMLVGPFGLLGNMVLGSGLGLLSTTDQFKSVIFGEEHLDGEGNKTRDGGLVGALRVNVVNPLKDFASTIKENTEDFVINDLIRPLKEGIKPIVHEVGLLAKGTAMLVPKLINKLFESTFGRPLQDLMRDYLIKPLANTVGRAGKMAGGLGKAVVSAPFKAVGVVGRSLQSKHIRKGDASYISAAERINFRKSNKGRGALSNIPLLGNTVFGSMGFNPTGYRDQFIDIDRTLAGIQDPEKLKGILDNMTQITAGKGYYDKQNRKIGRGFMAKVSAKFGSGISNRIRKAMEANDLDTVQYILSSDKTKPLKGMEISQEERAELIKEAGAAIQEISENKNKKNISADDRKDMLSDLRKNGFKGINEKNIGKIKKLVGVEYDTKKGKKAVDTMTNEQKVTKSTITDPITSNADKNADKIVQTLATYLGAMTELQKLSLPKGKGGRKIDSSIKRNMEAAKNNPAISREAFAIMYPEEAKRMQQEEDMAKASEEERANIQKEIDDDIANAEELRDLNTLHRPRRKRQSLLGLAKRGYEKFSNSRMAAETGASFKNIKNSVKAVVLPQQAKWLNAKENRRASEEGVGSDGEARQANVKWEYDSDANAMRKFIWTSSGWSLAPGKTNADADRSENNENKNKLLSMASSLGGMLKKALGIGKEETGEREPSFLSKLLKGAGKLLLKLGIGATAIAGTGHASEYVKNKVVPFVGELWDNRIKPFFVDKVGPFLEEKFGKVGEFINNIPTALSNFGKKAIDFITGKTENGGLPAIFKEKIFPWFKTGFIEFGENILTPFASWTVQNLGNIIGIVFKGIIKPLAVGIGRGIKNLVSGDKEPSYTTYNTDKISKPVYGANGTSFTGFSFDPTGIDVGGGTKNTGSNAGLNEEQVTTRDSLQAQYDNSKDKSPAAIKTYAEQALKNAKAPENTFRNGIDGKKYATNYLTTGMLKDTDGNTILADGTSSTDNIGNVFMPGSGSGSVQNRLAGYAARKFMGVKGFSGIAKGAANLGGKGISLVGKGISKTSVPIGFLTGSPMGALITKGIGGITNLAGKAVSGVGNLIGAESPVTIGNFGKAGARMQSATVGSFIGDIGEKLASKNGLLGNLGEKMAGSRFASVGRLTQADNIYNLANKTTSPNAIKTAFNAIRHPISTIKGGLTSLKRAPGELLASAGSAVGNLKDNLTGVLSKGKGMIKGVGDAAAGFADDIIEKGFAKTVKDNTKNTVKSGISGLADKIKKFISSNADKFFGDRKILKYFRDAIKSYGKEMAEEAVEKEVKKIGKNIASKFVKAVLEGIGKATAVVTAKISSTIASAGLATIVFAVYDFIDGAMHAENTFGFAKASKDNDGIEIGFFERVMAGLLRTANGLFTFGLVPEKFIIDIFMEHIAPIFKMDTTEFYKNREDSIKIMEEYNATHNTDYTDIEAFNQRNSFFNKSIAPMGRSIKQGASKVGSAMASGAKSAGSWIGNKFKAGASYVVGAFGGHSNNIYKYGLGRAYQNDPRYANIPFNKGSDNISQTIGDSGCGPAAAVNAINYAYGTGNDLVSAANMAVKGGYKEKNGGTNPRFFKDYFSQNGLQAKQLNGAGSIKDNLTNGNPVVLMGKDTSGGYDTPYGPNPHYVTAKGLDNRGNVIIDDPESKYGTARYPASKVLGKSSVAVAASKYGRGKSYKLLYLYKGTNDNITGNGVYHNGGTEISSDLLHKKKPSGPSHKVLIDGIGFLGNSADRWMLDSDIAKISQNMAGYVSSKPITTTKSTTTNTPNYALANPYENAPKLTDVPFGQLRYSSGLKVPPAKKVRVAFSCIPWKNYSLNKFYTDCTDSAVGMFKDAISSSNVILSESDNKKTVQTILSSKLGISLSAYQSFANDIAVYADSTLVELKEANSGLYNTLKNYAKDVAVDVTSSDAARLGVGAICAQFGLKFDGERQKSATSEDYSTMNDISNTSEYDEFQQGNTQPEKKSIFQRLTDSFVGLFDYTDKSTGEVKNALEIFGIGSRSSSSSDPQYSANVSSLIESGDFANGFPFYNQSDPRWGKIPYGKKGNIGSSGCGPTSMATVISSFGNTVTPKDTAAWSQENGFRVEGVGTSHAFFKAIGNKYDISTLQQSGQPSPDYLVNNLKKGYPVITSMRPGDFTKSGHFITLVGLDQNGKILVNDSAGEDGKSRTAKPWDPNTVASQAKASWIFNKDGIGSIGRIKAVGSGSTTNAAGGTAEQNKQTIWNFLKKQGYSDTAAAGIMGNIAQECSYNHAAVQAGASNPGLGICQWTYKTRKDKFLAAVPDWKTNLGGQLDFMMSEIKSGYPQLLPDGLNKFSSIEAATRQFHDVYEGSADTEKGLQRRVGYSQDAYTQLVKSGSSTYGTGKYYSAGKRSAAKYGMASNIVRGGNVSSVFNDPTRLNHTGIDIAGRQGQPVICPVNGIVYRAETNDANGNMVVVKDDNGYLYTFCHLKSIKVKAGARVSVGTILGTLGSTGDSFGDHVHYQVTNADGQYVDPSTKKVAAMSEQRAIGGSNGTDYTELIKIIIELLSVISDNTASFTKVLATISEKTGVDMTGVDTSSKSKALNGIKDKLRALDTGRGKGADLGSSMMNSSTDYLIKAMSTIAAD